MNTTRHDTNRWRRLAWLPIPLLAAAIIVGNAAGLHETYQNDTLRLILSFTFYTFVSLGTLFLIGRNFLTSGSPGLLLLECGVVLWSLAGTVGDLVDHGDANINVTIFNTGILLAGLCHLAGAILSLRPLPALRATPLWLTTGCALALGALGLVTWAALAKWLPVFFIPGLGGTPVRVFVLIAAIATFVLSAGLLLASQRASAPRRRGGAPFTTWYAMALLLLAVGLFGIMIQLSLWSVVNWLARTAQWLGGFYLFLAAIVALRESNVPLFPAEVKARSGRYRYGVAIAIVLAAAAVRLTFLSALGTHIAFFYSAVMLAALYGGLRTGLLATGLAALLTVCFLIPSNGLFAFTDPSDWPNLVIFVLSGVMIAWVSEEMRRARARAAAAETEALVAAEREAAAEVLRKSEERYHTLFTGMTEGFAIHDLLTDESGNPVDYRFLDVNPAFELLTGLKRQDVVGKTYNEILPDEDPKWLRMYSQVALTGQPVQFENYAPVLKRHYQVFAYRPAPMQFAVIFVDITERKRAEEALRESEANLKRLVADLKRSNYDLEQFAYISSHDLQEPLRQVAGFVEMFQRHYSNLFDDQAREFMGFITEGTSRMAVLIKDLLTYSRVGRTDKGMQPVNLAEIVQGSLKILRSRTEETHAEITVEDLPIIQGNATMLGQLFQNLVGNALKFGGEAPPIIAVGCRREDDHWLFWVRDNGIGFAQESAEKIFEVFKRLHNREMYEGTGVGLAICKRVIELHGGRIWAESQPGNGATFYFTIPASKQG